MIEWKTIDSAPKDGTLVLLYDGRRLCDGRSSIPDVGRWFDSGVNELGFWAVHAIRWEPSHWMELPKAPQGS